MLKTKINCSYKESARRFINTLSINALVALLETYPERFYYHINNPRYYTFSIPKKNGKSRTIQAPEAELKCFQKRLNHYLQAVYITCAPVSSHGFMRHFSDHNVKRNILTNAKVHCDSKFILNMDLKDFFSSISARRVYECFSRYPFSLNDDLAKALALLSTYNKQLPTGAPSSPVIANFICLDLDKQLNDFSIENNIRFTRYADDLTFSSDRYFSEEIISNIRIIVERSGFSVNSKKLRLQSSRRRQTVTGIVVNQKPNVDRRYIRQIRAILYDCKTNGVEKAAQTHYRSSETKVDTVSFLAMIRSRIGFIQSVRGKEDPVTSKLIHSYKQLAQENIT